MKKHVTFGGLIVLVAVVASVLLLVLLVEGCSAPQLSPAASTSDTKPYGSLVMATTFGKNSFDPQVGSLSDHQGYASAVIESLVEVNPEGQVGPEVAERWEISDDGKAHTFYIRKGIKFHNGDDLTGADVKFSIERMMAPTANHTDAPVWRGQIDSVDLKDDYTVVIRLKQPQFELLKGFADFTGSPGVLPKKYIEEKGADYFRKNPIGSGPFKVVSWTPSSRIEFEAVENHWRVTPKFKNITLIHTNEEATKVAMLKTGELDISSVSPDSVSQLKAAGLKILAYDGASQSYAYIFYDLDNPQKYALSDVRVRKAMSLAINRKELVDKIFSGYAEPSALMYAAKTGFYFDSNVLKPDPFDPEQAKKLLAEAGYAGGFRTTITDMGGGGALTTVNLALAGYFRNVAITADVVPLEYATALSRLSPKQTPDAWNTMFSWFTTGGVFQFEKMVVSYHSTKSFNKNLRNPRLDELIDKVPLTRDPAEKKKMALEATVLAKNEYNILSILDLQTIYAISSKIGQVTPHKGMVGLSPSFETIAHAK